jgi:hypothetical protein
MGFAVAVEVWLTLGLFWLEEKTTVIAPTAAKPIPSSSLIWKRSRRINGANKQFAINA